MKVNDLAATLAQALRKGNIHVGSGTGEGLTPVMKLAEWDVDSVRSHFVFPTTGRIVTNNAASTQPARELLELIDELAPHYDNVHRGQSSASLHMTARFEAAYDDIARFVGAHSRRAVVVVRNTTEAINVVMRSLLAEFRDGDNVVTTLMEHNSNYVPWHAMCREILPAFGRHVELRVARFHPLSGELDLDHLASLIDHRTKVVCCTGASNFLGTRNPLATVRAMASDSGYLQPSGEQRSYLLVDAAQLVPGSFVDMRALDIDFLVFSFHKMLAPFGAGALVAKERLLEQMPPFLYGGDMIAEGQVFADRVAYNTLPWKFAAGTPNIIGTIVSAQALRLLIDLASTPQRPRWFGSERPIDAVPTRQPRRPHGISSDGARFDASASDRESPSGPRCGAPQFAGGVQRRGSDPLARPGPQHRWGRGEPVVTARRSRTTLGIEASCRFSFYLYNTFDGRPRGRRVGRHRFFWQRCVQTAP
jgi:cysteine desulfurase/selenocysteine lyase